MPILTREELVQKIDEFKKEVEEVTNNKELHPIDRGSKKSNLKTKIKRWEGYLQTLDKSEETIFETPRGGSKKSDIPLKKRKQIWYQKYKEINLKKN